MINELARRLRENVQEVIVGKDEVIDMALAAILCEGHILFEDVPGIGKTTLARALFICTNSIHPRSFAFRCDGN
jgi:MoxR-like ATPase